MLALIEIRRRKLQFGFVTGVVLLIAYLIMMVTGLGLGLNQQAGTALLNLNGDHLAYASNANLSVIRSRLADSDVSEIRSIPEVERATPLGYVAVVIEYAPETSDTAAILGVIPGSFAEPEVIEGRSIAGPNEILIDRTWTRLAGAGVGDSLALPVAFDTRTFTVVGIVDQGYFFFQPAMYVDLSAWQAIVFQGEGAQQPAASVVLLQGQQLAGRSGAGWQIVTKQDGFENIEGVRAQQSTVDALRYMGLLIGAMVIGVFFYVITLQKTALLGILKAIGASGVYLVTQGLLQVLVVSVAGAGLAVGLALLTEATVLSSDSIPIRFTWGAIATAAISVVVAGLVGVALSARQVTSIDPIIAMQQQ
ncbi:MAG: ABC transporter permease [Chloroflexi bacterium]|nr:ABC transporter permease [Chloroflexota bacterium]